MTKEDYSLLEKYMLSCADHSAHDSEHIYRVLYNALKIAESEESVDYDVLIAACLLHDVGRKEQFEDPAVCHAEVGSRKAYAFLMGQGFEEIFAQKVSHCILTHRFRKNRQPLTIEAKILFDADKLDVTGAIGIARTLMYRADTKEPLYEVLSDGRIGDGSGEEERSFFREYKYKLEKIYDRFYTTAGAALAQQRKENARQFYDSLYREVREGYDAGRERLNALVF